MKTGKSGYGLPLAGCAAALVLGSILTACGGSGSGSNSDETQTEPTPISMNLAKIGEYVDGTLAAAEITAYDPVSKRVFVVNGALGTVDVLDLSNPAAPTLIDTISAAGIGAGVNSVAIHNGIAALAIDATVKTEPGFVAFYRTSDLTQLSVATVGALPDMVTFTPDGTKLLVANEGEPNSYGEADSVDPEGSVSIIDVRDVTAPVVSTAGFSTFNGQEAELRTAGVRIFGPGASVAQDLEPEYIAISADSRTAYVTLQENNALAIVDVATATVTNIVPLGYKDHNVAGFGLDASDEDDGLNTNSGTPAINIAPQPVKGMYMPDGIAYFTANGAGYLITANEGDAREYTGLEEEQRARSYCGALDPAVFPDAANLMLDSNLGRLEITNTPNGGVTGKNGVGECTELYAFGARSFSIWDANGTQVYDSGDELEQRTKDLANVNFNASNSGNELDSRSDSKGPEPEGVTVATFGAKTFAFIGLERVGGVMVYDVTNPVAPTYVTYINTRTADSGDRGPEGLAVISAADSPSSKPLLIVGNETSGSTAIYEINLDY